jgi:hypothetical protein
MSRYQWPSRGTKNTDLPLERRAYNSFTDGVLTREALLDARAPRPTPLAPPTGSDNVWVPIGPSTVLMGQAGSRPRITGRVRDLAVSPDGQRVYAATANGGVWYTNDAGTSWFPLGNWLPTPGAGDSGAAATPLTCGCLLVEFGVAADGSGDTVYVGTGEITHRSGGTPGGKMGGVGVLRLNKPLPQVLADPFGNHWDREAANLAGHGIFRLARDPNDADRLIAATSNGLFTRSGTFVVDADWTAVDFGAGSVKRTTDVLWVTGRLWVAAVARAGSAVWTSTNGVTGPFQRVDLVGVVHDPASGTPRARLALAAAPSDPTIVYVLGSGPQYWRIDGVTPSNIGSVPFLLFTDDITNTYGQSAYDMAIAVQPDNPNILFYGGAAVTADGSGNAALFRSSISPGGPGFSAGFTGANQATPGADPTFIGNGVHADVHQIKIVKTGAEVHVWVGCDGGVYRSTAGGDRHTFLARNNGLAVLQPGYVACHPVNDALVTAGNQDNGVQLRMGDSVWLLDQLGDGGGVIFHPIKDRFYASQAFQTFWKSNGTLSRAVRRGLDSTSEDSEHAAASFYSGPAIRRRAGPDRASLAIGTNRVWLADNWDPEAAATTWVTLPSNRDPRAVVAGVPGTDTTTDTYGAGTGEIICCKWATDERLFVLIRSSAKPDGADSAVRLLQRDTGTGNWTAIAVSEHVNKKSNFGNSDIDQPTSTYLPPLGSWSDLTVHQFGRGTRGSVYVAATGLPGADRMDTLWWFDGGDKWYPTTLRTSPTGTKAPAYAVVCDPDDDAIVFVGTALGVWRGQLTLPAGAPHWEWAPFNNGLPEAAVHDLAFHRNTVKILRAALASRGVFEIDLSAAPGPVQRTYLRAHASDARRVFPAVLTNPTRLGPADWPWHASPDVRIRPAPLGAAEAVSAPPTTGANKLPWPPNTRDIYFTWILQTALHKTDPLVRPNGQWTPQFEARLRVQDPALGTAITLPRWNAIVTRTNVFAAPWEGTEPTEADLMELIVENPPVGDGSFCPPAVSLVKRRRHLIDVLVHHRDSRPIDPTTVRVTLLRRNLPATPADWPTVAIGDPWKTKVEQLMSGAPPAGALPDGWTPADAVRTRPPTAPLDARNPRVVTFTVDFSALARNQHMVLLAIVHSDVDGVTAAGLTGVTLRELVLNSHHVAARVVKAV